MKAAFPSIWWWLIIFATVSNGESKVTEAALQKVAKSLQMYVDELPEMPKIYGYNLNGDIPKPINLTIGTYEKKWIFWTNNLKTIACKMENDRGKLNQACQVMEDAFHLESISDDQQRNSNYLKREFEKRHAVIGLYEIIVPLRGRYIMLIDIMHEINNDGKGVLDLYTQPLIA
ncbi:hypothetical protein C2S51_026867 [Perilla frutescens var. frutescens]|nr:hypothetical protein C2S51_026867 [Perilla frutescens var. frutescens]